MKTVGTPVARFVTVLEGDRQRNRTAKSHGEIARRNRTCKCIFKRKKRFCQRFFETRAPKMMEAMYFRGLEVVKKYFSMKSNREATDRYNFVNFFVDQLKK
jgi:hypothetical protein